MPWSWTRRVDARVPIAGSLPIAFARWSAMLSPVTISIALMCLAFVVAVMYLFVDERA